WALWPQPPHPAPGTPVPGTPARALCAALLPRAGVLGLFCLPALLLMLAELGGVAGCANVFGRVVESDAQVVMLDVGQGDAMLVRDGSCAVLVDTGEEGPVLLAALARQGVSRLDAVLVSHLDKDHCGALGALAGVVEVGAVYLHAELLQREEAAALLEDARRASRRQAQGVLPGARVQLGRFELELLAPVHAATGDNGDSLVWLLSFDADGDGTPEQRGLLTGDAEAEELAAVAARTGRVSFVKLGHHGSAGCMSAAELAALRPSLALIGVGEGNRYGHPHASTLALMRAAGVRVLRTDTQGDLRLLFSADALGVATQRGSP
ncbi:MAG: MBL fold metallo-hydrolase, partial [Coriobacteriaceae bacterium]|nr:MBL fold metallo-hydrolase [Coriobacteriaceae bacterium]